MNDTDALPRACVIGAGSSGITAAKALADRDIPFDCFEASDKVGGNWVFGNRNGMSSSYSTLHINTSRERMEYADYPMPPDYPDFPRHDQIARYFDEYVEHFGLRERITFNTGVEHVRPLPDGGWEVTIARGSAGDGGDRGAGGGRQGEGADGGEHGGAPREGAARGGGGLGAQRETRRYDALLVANGHHWNPRWPEPPIPGAFAGEQIHAHDYKEPAQLAGRRVVVVGMGNSAMDIAVDASYHARSTTLVARRGVHVVPKYILGRPLDAGVKPSRLPFTWLLRGMQLVTRLTVGPMDRYGLPLPDHRLGQAHPTVSSRILDRLAHGAIAVKPEIAALDGERVRYADGSEQEADLIVYCTGYKITFPFFDDGLIAAADNRLVLYKRVFDPDHPGLCFIGFVQPWGAIMPIAEIQGRLVAEHLCGDYALPSPGQMRGDMEAMMRRQARRYQASKRHTIQVDFSNYVVELDDERRAGAARARERGFAPRAVRPDATRAAA
ncbi:MAG TPA: NAD(P)-binding domain-containing protein [Solirubrobacteraceae bacterium]|jgi:dimethylaniline monooxygenase (N-oxide forming)|nr:NAD(P)-binding domain-containing protein [Solirubrobacteraceae bacterium]